MLIGRHCMLRLVFSCALFASLAHAALLTPIWVELAPGGQVLARVVVDQAEDCPVLEADGKALPLSVRAGTPAEFKPACEASIPSHTRHLRWNGKNVPLPRTPRSVIV